MGGKKKLQSSADAVGDAFLRMHDKPQPKRTKRKRKGRIGGHERREELIRPAVANGVLADALAKAIMQTLVSNIGVCGVRMMIEESNHLDADAKCVVLTLLDGYDRYTIDGGAAMHAVANSGPEYGVFDNVLQAARTKSWQAKAISYRKRHPTATNQEVADAVGISRAQVGKNQALKALRKAGLRDAKQDAHQRHEKKGGPRKTRKM